MGLIRFMLHRVVHHLFPRDPTPGSESRNAPQIRTSLNYKVGDVEADAAAPLRALKLF